ncbi:HAMP domain-containing histidine kinase [Pedobacter frigiditerrae]|uniref:histidine kinase n=1 Tax=Pedobacter frigiditerrae TaxID=2530452 RepID=A0A4R0MJM0_9SPHI|nr:HAMP domain-containing sensor histidine kinase [Pedobacter frigiditerrae]TCC86603.1 HAMP domain-containing histidine kinase [Pedobacter frigiditerrae]
MNSFKETFSSFWKNLIGSEVAYSLECRIFNAVTIFAVFTASVNAIVNFCLGLVEFGFLMFPLIGVLFLCYYLSRYKGKLALAVGICALSFNLLCAGTYFEAAGSSGVNLFTFILIIFLLTIVCSRKQFWVWIPLNILLLIVLLTLEYMHPEWVKPLYENERHKLLDLAQTFFEIIFMMTVITVFMKNSYNKEKGLAEDRLIALQESNETKNKLFSIVAHDLKAPLASIENYLTLLNELELSDDEKARVKKGLLISTRQTSEMLENILLWSKDQMDGVLINLANINLHDTLNHTIGLQNNLATEKGISLNYEVNKDLAVVADPDMLQLIVRNLLNNAIKFSHEHGAITIRFEERPEQCLIIVSDNGIGVKESEKPFIFSLKSKGTYGTNHEKGVGLGLRLAQTYVGLQHGDIWFESVEGKGTVFYVGLPKG